MKKQLQTNKICLDVSEIDFSRLFRVGEKVKTFLARKIEDPIEMYLLLKILCYSVEDSFGFFLDEEEEAEFRKMLS